MSGYWARIESVTDGLGHVIRGLQTVEDPRPVCATTCHLRVGDQVVFTCRGIDPLARTNWWTISFSTDNDHDDVGLQMSASGDEVEFCWTASEHQISATTGVQITMASNSPTHRWPDGWDGFAGFLYKVLPRQDPDERQTQA